VKLLTDRQADLTNAGYNITCLTEVTMHYSEYVKTVKEEIDQRRPVNEIWREKTEGHISDAAE